MQTLAQLKNGKLVGIKRLTLAENLTLFPLEILALADSLEVLDLSNNQLTNLPKEITQLIHLKILFASNNLFEKLPEVIGECTNLEMVGFKANKIKEVPENSLPKKLRWLILTDNKIEKLPDSLGNKPYLQKLALAGNQLTCLPQTLAKLTNLELIRISANQLTEFPTQLFNLPKLAWLAFSGNPFSEVKNYQACIPVIYAKSFILGKVLGQGASGVIYQAQWNKANSTFPSEVAIKVFKGEVTSDGYPQDELNACLKVGNHPNLVQSLAQVKEPNYLALIMNLIPAHYTNLGLPPSLKSCTRDTFKEGYTLSIIEIEKIIQQIKAVFEHCHNNQVSHGDLYAHNTLVDDKANIIFGDFGAATMYHMLSENQQEQIKLIEQRALRYFIDDLLSICKEEDKNSELYLNIKKQVK